MYKKILSVIAALALCFGALAGCGGSDNTALSDGIEEATKFYSGYADIVSEYGSVQQNEEFDDAKAQLDAVAERLNDKLTEDELSELLVQVGEIQSLFISIGSAAMTNMPQTEEDASAGADDSDAEALSDLLESTATLLSGIAENVNQNGSDYQKNLISGYQDELSGYASEADEGVDNEKAAEIEFRVKLMTAAANSVNDRINENASVEGEVDLDDLNDKVEATAKLVNGAAENILAGDDQTKKDFINEITDEMGTVSAKVASGEEISVAEANEIYDALDVIEELVKAVNE